MKIGKWAAKNINETEPKLNTQLDIRVTAGMKLSHVNRLLRSIYSHYYLGVADNNTIGIYERDR